MAMIDEDLRPPPVIPPALLEWVTQRRPREEPIESEQELTCDVCGVAEWTLEDHERHRVICFTCRRIWTRYRIDYDDFPTFVRAMKEADPDWFFREQWTPPASWDDGWYKGYRTTPAWRTRRALAAQLAGDRCEHCGRLRQGRGGFDVHHVTYERLGHEDPEDLLFLCRRCHEEAHSPDAPFTEPDDDEVVVNGPGDICVDVGPAVLQDTEGEVPDRPREEHGGTVDRGRFERHVPRTRAVDYASKRGLVSTSSPSVEDGGGRGDTSHRWRPSQAETSATPTSACCGWPLTKPWPGHRPRCLKCGKEMKSP